VIKDLSLLGRDLSKVLIVDNIEENFRRQPENGIKIVSWYDDMKDKCLIKLQTILKGNT
jgi:CTD small phosphatase-like protein 2